MAAGLVITRGSAFGLPNVTKKYLSGGTFAANELVNLESGEALLVSTGDEVLGVSKEAATSSSTGVQVDVTPGLQVVMDNDNVGTTFAATHVGGGFDVLGATGALFVDTSTILQTAGSVAGQLRCLEYNPQGLSSDLNTDTSVGLFLIAERQLPL